MIPHFVPYVAKVEQERRKEAKELVQRAARHLRKVGFKASEIVEQGDTKTKIVDYAANWSADLIVLGSHGWKSFGPVLDGKRVGSRNPSCRLFRRGHSASKHCETGKAKTLPAIKVAFCKSKSQPREFR